tara:strand:+ start:147 stop:404 length:258 start_codon:yes stop_codon:yes gene_type:complete
MADPTLTKQIKAWTKAASALSYEESLQALDLLLTQLQNDAVPMAELQRHYLQGQIYLEHCKSLLEAAEQTVIQLDPDSLEINPNA